MSTTVCLDLYEAAGLLQGGKSKKQNAVAKDRFGCAVSPLKLNVWIHFGVVE